jgi:hypothetical protein
MTPRGLVRALVAAAAAALVAAAAAPLPASAGPRPLPMSEPYETLLEDKLELEQRIDAVPVHLERPGDAGLDGEWGLRAELATELRIGWSDRLELGVSATLRQAAGLGPQPLHLAGFGQRARLRVLEEGTLPIDLAIQVALAEYTDGVGGAERAIASWRRDALVALASFQVEQRYGAPGAEWRHAYLATGGVSFELAPGYAVGAEYWARGRFDGARAGQALFGDPDDPGGELRQYAGPALSVQRGRLWISAGAYVRLDLISRGAPAGDPFGRLWGRALVGLEL